MNIYVKFVLELYGLFIRCIQFLMYVSLFMFNNQITYIKCFGENDEIFYLIPFLQICICPSFIPSITFYKSLTFGFQNIKVLAPNRDRPRSEP